MTQAATIHQTAHPCRLFGIFAREARVGVLFRRGPSKWVRLVKWSVGDDTFKLGQWFHGRIYERRCDLSPDGRLLIYFASKFTRKTIADQMGMLEKSIAGMGKDAAQTESHYSCAWTAVSKPPWLTALALWPKGDCWHGGGLFSDDKTVQLNHWPCEAKPHPNHQPSGLHVIANCDAQGEDWPVYSERLMRDGWKLEQKGRFRHSWSSGWTTKQEEIFSKRSICGRYDLLMTTERIDFEAYGGPYVLAFHLRPTQDDGWVSLGSATWADWDHRGRLIMAKDGRLFHCEMRDSGRIVPHLLYDFNDDKPQPVESPPEASDWDYV
jgi:hypothetical protein